MRSTTPQTIAGRVCVVTGASRGIGRVTALALARSGADVVLVGRDAARTEAAAEAARAQGGGGRVRVLLGDLSEPDGVKAVATAFLCEGDGLDVLINNAGAIFQTRETNSLGWERTFALNHLAYHALTLRLLPALLRRPGARIVNVASRAHTRVGFDLDDPMAERGYDGWRAYCRSKLANVLFTRELARRLAGSDVTANALHPGLVATHFAHEASGWYAWAARLARPWMIDEAAGARTTLHLATAPELGQISGQYWADCRPDTPSREGRDPKLAAALWSISADLTGLDWPEQAS